MVILILSVDEKMTEFTSLKFERWQYGKKFLLAQSGDLIIGRERNITLGALRVFRFNESLMYDKPVQFYAERKYKSIIPFRAPVVWWRRLEELE